MSENWGKGAIFGGILLVILGIGILTEIYPTYSHLVILAGGIGSIIGGAIVVIIAVLKATNRV